ncbi:type II toxin-antitoxin system RelE/ParE family toxin [Sphaerotilus mobilis]|uniref:Toxin ParE1/3/4 n=1 Tax=Sphaerotilus mobilis TaxID=47994 RepID=A0A4Q7LVK1_9BURK|nr:type II toxin-antitoxin system RelE/ParE family toxin [Sphaerotilus mobilis]RZS58377.1 toxin ParE1/3/4 [Sphaerotilus mobilis]
MTVCVWRPRAREDRKAEVRYYRLTAGPDVAERLVRALSTAQQMLLSNPAIGSPRLGQMLGITGLRTWRIEGYPMSYWYVERPGVVDIVRLVGHRLDPSGISVPAE